MTQIKLVDFEIARILSESASLRRMKFKKLTLIVAEREKYEAYSLRNVDTLSDCELVEFQKLYCKKRLTSALNSGKFEITLSLSVELRQEVKDWLKAYGYCLAPYQSKNTEGNTGTKSKHIYVLRW